MPAYSTAAFSERKLSEKGGVALLQYFGVSYSRVGHVCVHAARPFPCWACACTASDSLVVAERVIAKSEVVHAAYRTHRGEGGENKRSQMYVCVCVRM